MLIYKQMAKLLEHSFELLHYNKVTLVGTLKKWDTADCKDFLFLLIH